MDLKTQALIMQAAGGYADQGAAYLAQQLGRQPSDQEALIFASALSSMTGSWCYATIYKVAGRPHADTWMQQIFTQLGMGVKTRGVPVTLQISLKSIPGPAEAKPKGAIAMAEPAVPICKCVLDGAGRCSACAVDLAADLGLVIDFMGGMEKFQGKLRCSPCIQKHFDGIFSQVVQNKFKGLSQELKDMIIAMAVQMGASHGVEGIPATEKALAGE